MASVGYGCSALMVGVDAGIVGCAVGAAWGALKKLLKKSPLRRPASYMPAPITITTIRMMTASRLLWSRDMRRNRRGRAMGRVGGRGMLWWSASQ